jgi:hypothetical protein
MQLQVKLGETEEKPEENIPFAWGPYEHKWHREVQKHVQ